MKHSQQKKIKAWAIVPNKYGAKFINRFVGGIKRDYYGALRIPQLGIYPRKYGKFNVSRNCNGYEKVVPVTILLPKEIKKK